MDLKPNENIDGNKEFFDEYYPRIKQNDKYGYIPKEVLKQWIYPLHKNNETLKNYSWIDYENVEFSLYEWNYDMLRKLYVIKDFRNLVNERGSYNGISKFCCTEPDKKYWEEEGTWQTPPIILDVNSFYSEKPDWSELKPPYQLVEGHQRLGYLHSMRSISDVGEIMLAKKHKIYLMRRRGNI